MTDALRWLDDLITPIMLMSVYGLATGAGFAFLGLYHWLTGGRWHESTTGRNIMLFVSLGVCLVGLIFCIRAFDRFPGADFAIFAVVGAMAYACIQRTYLLVVAQRRARRTDKESA